MKPRICVDFDDTIWDGTAILPGCIEALAHLSQTYTIAIFSARATPSEIKQMMWLLVTYSIPYDEVLPAKPEAVIYLDDKGWRFTGWQDFLSQYPRSPQMNTSPENSTAEQHG